MKSPCALRLFLFQTHRTPVMQCIVYMTSACNCWRKYSVTVHAHHTPSGLLMACGQ
jgi:hypothetical protein